MRTSRIVKHLGNIFLAGSFLILIYFAMNEEEPQGFVDRSSDYDEVQRPRVKNIKQAIRDEYEDEVGPFDSNWVENFADKSDDRSKNNFFAVEPLSKPPTQVKRPGDRDQGDVIVVVIADDPPEGGAAGMLGEDGYDNGVDPLEAPAKPLEVDVEDEDMLRENDVLVGDVVVDRSDDLLTQMNDTIGEIGDALHLGDTISLDLNVADSPYYSFFELLPPLKKPPSERNSPGEFGHPFIISNKMGAALAPLILQGYQQHGFNTIVSDIISVHRNLGDKREEQCKEKLYKKPLPTVSVIICFQNEAFSALRRTMYSVLETVPSIVLQEVILVDDNSQQEHLLAPLQREVAELSSLVTLLRTPKTLGVAKSRLFGLEAATGEVVAFLDSHCECYEGWIEPLLDRVRDDPTVIAIPVIEIIDQETFAFSVTPMQMVQRGGFDWTLTYRWIAPPRDRFEDPEMDMSEPIPTPTMSGGVFCANRANFLKMGSYDKGMEVWGAENLEISFRTWMCGGRLEIVPCSHVGHVFRNRAPEAANLQTVLKNKRRLAEVWLDDYKEIFMKRLPFAQATDGGNITARQDLRDGLQCKTFDWYLENVYPQLYIPELNPLHSGSICCRFSPTADVCIDTHNTDAIPGRLVCVDAFKKGSGSQYFEYTKQDELRQSGSRDICLGAKGSKVEIQRCGYPSDDREQAPDMQRWEITEDGHIMNFGNAMCLTASTTKAWLDKCDAGNKIRQTWKWR